MVELMGVAVLVVILAALAAPSFNRAMDLYRLQSSANMIAAEMEAARVLAVSRGASYRLSFTGNNTVTVIDVDDPDNPPRTPKRLERGITLTPPGSDIIFYPRGHASVAETVRVTNGEDELQVAVLVSGKVSVGTCSHQTSPGGGTVIPTEGDADSSRSGTEIQ